MSFSISGLSGSGLDITQIVNDLIEVERIPLKSLEAKKSNLSSEQSVFRQLNTKLNTLRTSIADLSLSGTFNQLQAKSTNPSALDVTLNGAPAKGSYTVEVVKLAQKQIAELKFTDNDDLSNAQFTMGDIEIDLDLDGMNTKERLEHLVKEFNKASTVAKATLLDTTGNGDYSLSLTTIDGKENENVSFSMSNVVKDGQTLASNLTSNNIQEAEPGEFKINGLEVTRASNVLNDVISGLTFTATAKGTSTIDVTQNVNAITGAVDKFVSAYNDVMELININLAKPDDDKTVNPLQGDSTLKALKDTLYRAVTGDATGNGGSLLFLEQIGISIDKNVTANQRTGKIQFDKTAFANALATDTSSVINIFQHKTEIIAKEVEKYSKFSVGGIAQKIAGYDSEIRLVDERIERMERSLEMKEARLKLQFNNMEIMLNSLNSQQQWLKSQLASLTKSNDN